MSDDSKNLSRVEDILSGEDYIPTKPMSRIEKLLLEGGGPGGKLPEVTSDDNGKILKVKDGAWDKGEDVSGDKLPQVSSQDNGKVLKVVQGEWNIDEDEGDRLPVITPSDNDKILTAYGGEWVPKTNPLPDARNYEAGSVLTVRNNAWNPELLPATPGVPRVESDDVGKVLKATGVDTYDWANGTDIIQTTQESYDAMSDSQKMNGKLYFVHNGSDDEDTAIYFMNKCYSKVPSGSKAVYLPLADYEELTTAEKEDPTKIYFVINEGTKVSPTLTADDGNVTASSKSGNIATACAPWLVFDGSDRTDNYCEEYAWMPWGQHNGEWVAYEFDQGKSFSKVHIRAATMKAHTMKYYIEGSNDGSNWTNLILGAEYVEANQPAYTGSNYVWVNTDIILDAAKGSFSHIRFRQDTSIGIPYSGDGIFVANWDIYASAASNKPSIYYKNVLYNPDELPATTISDAGKVLKVNEDGLWDKGDAPIPDINAVQVPPVIFDNGSLKKVNDVDGFPGLEKVYTTPTKYNALSDDEKNDLSKIYYVSDYEFYSDPDNPVVVRVGANNDIKWFFNGYTFANGARYVVPEKLREFQAPLNEQGTRHVRCDSTPYASPDATSPISSDYFVGWSGYDQLNQMRYSRIAGSMSILNGTVYAVIDPNGGAGQTNPYTDPYDIPNGMTIYYGGKQYTEYESAKPYVELTQAEYDALPSSKESDGMIYFING